ncbi:MULTISPECIES: glycosyl hydrolase family 18 protein [Brevibacillus]|jgi:spore germination protein|uniref:glycosyl hydrolase family 18 protein n=1 Tax=Brevibacillus TaxID=55080 RepID=UPI0004697529|nr:glycoside hydrolase family 18 protein [Brevibacillus borstelensis]MBE5394438.1 glycoside hydrolase family 18 protein [Brevibacillus borstelensis]MCC0564094.1 glycoside hydrolase family 18 protein [Brevibacillus borstelensis]MCM3470788.1 glycoside hydrolase family 18 protein [Brevibacillus borstelensis]MCM3558870.1 glycoside hydrolase family 18 protein [Brevibacillus borstelensis]MCM3592249.1 glycoside hydrolase family 18 protein [Brevibacillus borstelensis]
MQIHVVERGQTLNAIAERYDSTAQAIASANQIPEPDRLVVGQALVIPIVGSYYWVRPGDTLYTIGQRFGISAAQLARINRISLYRPIEVGLRLYIPPRPRRAADFNAYAEPRRTVTPALEADIRTAAPHLTYLAPFSFRINRDGTLTPPPLGDLRQIAQENEVVLMMVITNLERGQFSSELGSLVLNDMNVQNRLLDNIITTATDLGFGDIHFDMEALPAADREAYARFLRRARERARRNGLMMSVAVAPKTSAEQQGKWYAAHDYRAIGEIADFVVIMTYEWGYSGGPPMAVSPIGPVRRVLEYAITEMPASKIMMGQNLYGYDWTLPYEPGTTARALSPQAAVALAQREQVPIQYDSRAQAPFFEYTDDQGRRHRVWFEDARSIQAKFNLVKELGLRGVSYWRLGLPFPQNWLLIEENFRVRKRR